jgi:ribosomal protein S18 acetylase RimI-like enzyme
LKNLKSSNASHILFNPLEVNIRKAKVSDISQLVELENASFDYDMLNRRNFHWMIKKGHSIFLVLEYHSRLIGYGLVLINSGTSLARLYSICTLKEFQGYGFASKLIQALEGKSIEEEDCAYLRLEVKEDNLGAIKLYKKLGYTKFSVKKNYYDDGKAAYCFEKRIRTLTKPQKFDVPFYTQGTEFTCGPSTLMMAMKAFNPKYEMSLTNELQIWREATTIFMTSGHGGCGPHGLALSAWRRGYNVEMFLSRSDVLFKSTVRSEEKKKIIELVHKDFEKKISETNIKVIKKKFTLQDLQEALKKGGIPLVLITTYHFDNNRVPHWVVVSAFEDNFVYIHDPNQYHQSEHVGVVGRINIPIHENQFLKISRWGKDRLSAVVVIYREDLN